MSNITKATTRVYQTKLGR